jgi:glycyl-tRNA synthetase alpha chain
MYVQDVDDIADLVYAPGISYAEIFKQAEREWSAYSFEASEAQRLFAWFDDYEAESKRLAERGLVLPAYDFCCKASHTFNLLDARGVISVAERARYLGRVRGLARACADAWLAERERLGFPLLAASNA